MANYSLGEIDALCRKATRGAGYSWGIAEETGKAVRWLSAYGLSGAEILAKHLEIVSADHTRHLPMPITSNSETKFHYQSKHADKNIHCCSLYCGTLINDLGHHIKANEAIAFDKMLFPLLALPHAGRIAEAYGMTVAFNYDDVVIVCNSLGIQINNDNDNDEAMAVNKADVVCRRVEADEDGNMAQNTHRPTPQSLEIEGKALSVLEKFAHKTYAPATEESRLLGAGSGLNDND